MNIKDYYGITDPAYTEREIYDHFKHNTSWKLLVLKVRLWELFMSLPRWIRHIIFILSFKKLYYPLHIVEMVNKWEK